MRNVGSVKREREKESGNSKRPEMKEQTCDLCERQQERKRASKPGLRDRRRMKQNKERIKVKSWVGKKHSNASWNREQNMEGSWFPYFPSLSPFSLKKINIINILPNTFQVCGRFENEGRNCDHFGQTGQYQRWR